jgi:hypothetical protein
MVPVRVLVHPRPGDVPWTRFLPSEKVFTFLLYYFSMRRSVVCTNEKYLSLIVVQVCLNVGLQQMETEF